MTEQSRIGNVIDSDPDFEDRWWHIQKGAWGVMVLLVLAGLTGIFGRGPLSKATVNTPGVPLHVQYERFPRLKTPASLEVNFAKQTLTSSQAHVLLKGDMMNKLRIQQVMPMPASTQPLPDGAIFTFNLPPTANSAKVVFVQQASSAGFTSGEVALLGTPPIRLKQFIYP
jgi:hypothetical protein